MSTKTEACWDRTEGCCMTDAMNKKVRTRGADPLLHAPFGMFFPKAKRKWGDAPGMLRLSRFGDGWIVACRLCPPSSTGAPRNFAWPKGGLEDAIRVLVEHNLEEHPLRFADAEEEVGPISSD